MKNYSFPWWKPTSPVEDHVPTHVKHHCIQNWSPRSFLIPYSLAARPFSLTFLPAANQIIFPLQQFATLALDTFLRRQSCVLVALLLLTYCSPKGMVWFTTLELNQQRSSTQRCFGQGHSTQGGTSRDKVIVQKFRNSAIITVTQS